MRAEYFIPWYRDLSRPTIKTTTPRTLPHSGEFIIGTGTGTAGTSITRVALIAPGSVTHAFDVDQRYVELKIVRQTIVSVTVAVPSDPGVLPPGQYMLVISRNVSGNAAGTKVPSEGYWVSYPSEPPPPPPCTGGVYCCDQWYCPPNGCPII